ncbi:hypothetical protein [Kutzneria buriramensis]|uniref:Uncharacterized protein n=1 Tax=Kutzneria buriramensis TaxID=1045776 RepID=A0A3E0HQA7_9PSEU|nr:hypothetical protein [Kutzneria buriramensis]REH48416.1 hypothetical protein BCF44_105275 [Kutzneria buriramensis]
MHTHDNTPDTPGDDQDAVVVPLPRKALDDYIESLPETGSDQPVWWYDQKQKRGGDRTYSGHVNHVHGAEAERVRGELAKVIQELLDWAAQQQSGDQSTEDGEAA